MREVLAAVTDAIRGHAQAAAPREACGFVLEPAPGTWCILRACNVHPDPEHGFEIDGETAALAWRARRVVAIYHSHPAHGTDPSAVDRACATSFELPLVIYSGLLDRFSVHHPAAWWQVLCGRTWTLGEHDCFSLVAEAFATRHGLCLGRWSRPEPWPPTREDWFARHASGCGFDRLAPAWPGIGVLQPSDVLAFTLVGPTSDHLGLYVGDGRMVHHPFRAVSQPDDLVPAWQRRCTGVYRHRMLA